MADDVKVTIGAVSSGATSEFKRVGQQLESLRQSGKKLGGVLEGDRRVENKLTSWVSGLVNARNAADVLASTLGNLGDVFKTSLVLGAGLNIGGALVSGMARAIEESKKLQAEVNAVVESLRQSSHAGDFTGLVSNIGEMNNKIAEMRDAWGGWTDEIRQSERAIVAAKESLIDLADQRLELAKAERDGDTFTVEYLKKEIALREYAAKLKKDSAGKLSQDEINFLVLKESERLDILKEITKQNQDAAAAKEKENERIAEQNKKLQEQANLKAKMLAEETARQKKQVEEIAQLERNAEEGTQALREEEFTKRKQDEKNIAEFSKRLDEQYWEARKKNRDEDLAKAQKELDIANEKVKQAKANVLQGQREAAGEIGIYKGGASLPEQRASKAFYDRQADINAGVVARDEARRRFGGDADKLEEYKRRGGLKRDKDAILGKEKGGTVEDILTKALAEQKATATAVKALQEKLGIK